MLKALLTTAIILTQLLTPLSAFADTSTQTKGSQPPTERNDPLNALPTCQLVCAIPLTPLHTITSANESVIDTLTLSANTRARMHEAVQDGDTVYTPNKVVEDGEWTGILYIAIDPSIGDGTYAIGEQVQNRGWTTELFELVELPISDTYRYNNGTHTYSYTDSNTGVSKSCKISATDVADIAAHPQYNISTHGLPCLKETRQYGTIDHEYIVTTDAAHFKSTAGGYDYWTSESDASAKVAQADVPGAIDRFTAKLKLNTTAGTYSRYGSYGLINKKSFTAYYQPTSNEQGEVREVYGEVLDVYDNRNFERTEYACAVNSQNCIPNNAKTVNYMYDEENRVRHLSTLNFMV